MSTRHLLLLIVALIGLFLVMSAGFVVDQRQQVLILQFGKPIRSIQTPGLQWKMPFIQDVVFFDNRILNLSTSPREVTASDQKRLIVTAYVKYRITNPQRFYEAVKNESNLQSRLSPIVDSSLRQVIGTRPLSALLSDERGAIMEKIYAIVNAQVSGELLPQPESEPSREQKDNTGSLIPESAAVVNSHRTPDLGIKLVDLRIVRTDLPAENSEAIYRRMQTEREQQAKEIRAEGVEQSKRIRSEADKEVKIVLAEADKEAQITRGEGDAKATQTFADAFSRDPEFFAFYRTMQAYNKGLSSENTTMVLSPDSDFFSYFNRIGNTP